MSSSPAAPYEALARLSDETIARLDGGDADFLDEAALQRDHLLSAIATITVAPEDAAVVAAAIRRALAADARLLERLETHREQARRELAKVAGGRTALQSYRGAAPSGAIYIERLS